MQNPGLPEMMVITLVLLVPIALAAFALWYFARRKPAAVGSKSCGHCGQRIPDLGRFCPICGQRQPVP
jgi:predicted amidophosphoribosyltransferase